MIIALDFETGGIDPQKYSALEIGLYNLETKEVWATYIKEDPCVVDFEAMKVNQIALADISEGGLSPAETALAIHRKLNDWGWKGPDPILPLGHNCSFDMEFMKRLYFKAFGNLKTYNRVWSYRRRDTSAIARFLDDAGVVSLPSRANLKSVCEAYGVVLTSDNQHTAGGDAEACGRLYLEMINLMSLLKSELV